MEGTCEFCEEQNIELEVFITGQKLCKTCMRLRVQIYKRKQKEFIQHLNKASETVKAWPKWKKNIMIPDSQHNNKKG